MADYFVASVASGASNTSPYNTWAKAATSLATALAAATADGDRVIIQYNGIPSGDAELSADTTYTVAGNISIITSTNSGTSTVTPTAMGTGNWIGNSTTNRSVTFAGGKKQYIYGLTIRTSGSTVDSIRMGSSNLVEAILDNCYIWNGNTDSTSSIGLGPATSSVDRGVIFLKNSTLRFGATGQKLNLYGGYMVFSNTSISSSGSTPTTLISNQGNGTVIFEGCDLSLITGTLISNTVATKTHKFINCKLGAGVVIQATNTVSSIESYLFNCSSGDEHYQFGHYNYLGSTIVDTGIYASAGATYDGTNHHSWKIVTTSAATKFFPYISPFIDRYNASTSAITPSLEILRDGSATAYKDDEVWGEWSYQGTGGYPISTFTNDAVALAGSAADQTTGDLGAGDWTGENATAWFGKLNPASTITPAEIGHIRARVCVGIASSTVYVDPTIRGT